MSCPTPTYGVSMLVTPPPATLTQDEFFNEATKRCWATGKQYLAKSGIEHTPAYLLEDWPAVYPQPERTAYYVQVSDLSAGGYGTHLFTVRDTTAEACLAKLAKELREVEEGAYNADPARVGEQQGELAKDDGLYDYAA